MCWLFFGRINWGFYWWFHDNWILVLINNLLILGCLVVFFLFKKIFNCLRRETDIFLNRSDVINGDKNKDIENLLIIFKNTLLILNIFIKYAKEAKQNKINIEDWIITIYKRLFLIYCISSVIILNKVTLV